MKSSEFYFLLVFIYLAFLLLLFCFNMEVILLDSGAQLMHKWWVYCQEIIGGRLRCFLHKLLFWEELVFKYFIDLAVAELRWFWKAKSKAFIQYINASAHSNNVKRSHVTERANLGNTGHTTTQIHSCRAWEFKKELFPFFSEAVFSVFQLLISPFDSIWAVRNKLSPLPWPHRRHIKQLKWECSTCGNVPINSNEQSPSPLCFICLFVFALFCGNDRWRKCGNLVSSVCWKQPYLQKLVPSNQLWYRWQKYLD